MLISLALSIGCNENREEMTGPTIGSMRIVCDEHLEDIISQEEQIFERTYKYASLDITYTNAFNMFNMFFADSIDAMIATRPLSSQETTYFQQKNIYPRQYPFATSALAFIQKNTDPDSNYSYEKLISLLQDETGGRQFVIENSKSGIASFLMDILETTTLPQHIFALPDKDSILDYILQKERTIGIVDYSDISDSDAPYTTTFLRDITLIGISNPTDTVQGHFLRPYQYHLQENRYPFTQDLYFISKSSIQDVGTGFAYFMSGDIGQKIILKAGLFPKFQTERAIELKNTSDVTVIK